MATWLPILLNFIGKLYVDEDLAITEFILIPNSSNNYKIIGTNIINPAFPLFRYEVGDTATIHPSQVHYQGWPGRIVDAIDGRKEDYIQLPDGSKLGRLDHIFKDMIDIREAQLYQFEPNSVTLRIVKGINYDSNNTEKKLLNESRKRLGNSIKIEFDYVKQLQRSKTGKLRFVISEIKDNIQH